MQYDKLTQERMFQMIVSWKQSGLTQKAYCKLHDIRYYVFHYWYKRYRDEQPGNNEAAFIPLNVTQSSPDAACANIEVLLPGGTRILFHQAVSSNFLKALIS